MNKGRVVVVLGYASERDREKGAGPQAQRVAETLADLEAVARELYEQDLWLSYSTPEGRGLSSIGDARTFLHGR